MHLRRLAVTVAAGLVLAACGDDGSTTATNDATTVPPVIDPGDGGEYHPDIDPANFVEAIDNPWLPLRPGNRWEYDETEDGETAHIVVTVLDETRDVAGITATVVRDRETLDGVVQEDTYDWFAQDADGNVWYLGEDVDNYEDGELVDHDGSWETGVDGALPGIAMPADPQVGDAYRQEYYPGEAEDLGEVIATDGTTSGPTGDYTDLVVVREWNPLEPDKVEEKSYARGTGMVGGRLAAGGESETVLTGTNVEG